MDILSFSFITAFLASFAGILLLRPFAYKVGLIDLPTHRKRHQGAVPLIGGLALYLAVFISGVTAPEAVHRINLWLACAGILVVIGALDDKFDVPASARLAIQILVSLTMMIGSNMHLSSLGNLFGLGELNLLWFGLPVSALAIVTAINAFNMVDGIDGLLGVHTLTAVVGISLLMVVSGGHPFLVIALALTAAMIPYLIYNLCCSSASGRKIFMGDSGSMLIGFAIVWLLIEGSQGESASFRPVTAVWLIALPLMDLVSTIMRRIRKGKSPFQPDRTHLHHIIQRMGFDAKSTLLIIALFSTLIAAGGIAFELLNVPESLMMIIYLALFVVYDFAVGRHAWKLIRIVKKTLNRRSW